MAHDVREDTLDPLAEMQRISRRISRLTRELTREVAAFKEAAARAGIRVEFVHNDGGTLPPDHPQAAQRKDAQ